MANLGYVERTATLQQRIGHLVEECGEVCAAAGKTLRWGLESSNPELPSPSETNRAWLLREIRDLELAAARARVALETCDTWEEACS